MIALYSLHWSHFVEKVRWALDYKQLQWREVNVNPFTKQEMKTLDVKRIENRGYKLFSFPTIHDTSTDVALGDSTPIIEYLEKTYPESPKLFPSDEKERFEVKRWMLKLDSELGPDARRLCYLQCIVEIPELIPKYFAPQFKDGSLPAWLSRVFVCGVLIQRFRMHKAREDLAFENLLALLLPISRQLEANRFLVGNEFTAADITLASLLRPLRVVPFFRDHENLQSLFDWQADKFKEHRREPQMLYEKMMLAHRLHVGYNVGVVPWLKNAAAVEARESSDYEVARNDQRRVGRAGLVLAPWFYFKLRYFNGLRKSRWQNDVD